LQQLTVQNHDTLISFLLRHFSTNFVQRFSVHQTIKAYKILHIGLYTSRKQFTPNYYSILIRQLKRPCDKNNLCIWTSPSMCFYTIWVSGKRNTRNWR